MDTFSILIFGIQFISSFAVLLRSLRCRPRGLRRLILIFSASREQRTSLRMWTAWTDRSRRALNNPFVFHHIRRICFIHRLYFENNHTHLDLFHSSIVLRISYYLYDDDYDPCISVPSGLFHSSIDFVYHCTSRSCFITMHKLYVGFH